VNGYDVDCEAVYASGTRTAGTAAEWRAWAGEADVTLRGTPASLVDPAIGAAMEGYVGDTLRDINWLPEKVMEMARAVCAGANVITDAQAEIVGNLRPVVADAERLHEESARPIDGRPI